MEKFSDKLHRAIEVQSREKQKLIDKFFQIMLISNAEMKPGAMVKKFKNTLSEREKEVLESLNNTDFQHWTK